MQSLKSTAFAVTLLAISFGLYCVSSPKPELETEIVPGIEIDSSMATDQNYPMSPEAISRNPMTLPTLDINTVPSVNQVSTGSAGGIRLDTGSLPSVPQLPGLGSTGQTSTGRTSTGQTSNSINLDSQLKLPEISMPTQQGSFQVPENVQLPKTIELPEISTRQPVSTTPAGRDQGLIDALSSPRDTGGSFQPQPTTADNSYTALAGAMDSETGRSQKTANAFFENSKPQAAAKLAQNPTAITAVWDEVDELIAADEYRKALGTLSKHYGRKGLTGPQQQKLQGWLDALAGKVIYSTEHHFVRQPYIVKNGENLASIAGKLQIPAEVIYNINRAQFGVSNEVTPGMELKVINGPFHAEVNLETKMMTLFVKNLYAGRFPVAIGISGNPDVGNYRVMAKSPNGFTWRDADGKEYPAGTPGNGYGPYWIGLSGSLCIHAVEDGTVDGHRGCIGLGENDAKDVYGILSKESQISITR